MAGEEEEQEGAVIWVGMKGLREEVGLGAEVEEEGKAGKVWGKEEEAEAKEIDCFFSVRRVCDS